MRRLDHAGIYALTADTYTPFRPLVLHGAWSVVVLAIVWSGAAAPLAALMAGSVRADAAGVG